MSTTTEKTPKDFFGNEFIIGNIYGFSKAVSPEQFLNYRILVLDLEGKNVHGLITHPTLTTGGEYIRITEITVVADSLFPIPEFIEKEDIYCLELRHYQQMNNVGI